MPKTSSQKLRIEGMSKVRQNRLLNSILTAQDAAKKVVRDHDKLVERAKWKWQVLPLKQYKQAESDMKELARFVSEYNAALVPGEVEDDDDGF